MTTTALGPANSQSTATPDPYASLPHSRQVMRQTQALMGVVLLAGTAAALLVNMAWVIIPIIIGAGLIFAGISGLCPMASLIGRMPWNRAAENESLSSERPCCGGGHAAAFKSPEVP